MKNINELNEILSEQIDLLRTGNSTAANVNAVCNATGKIISNVRLQLEYAKLTGQQPEIPMMLNATEPKPVGKKTKK